jgi:hypothetical protein
MVALPYTAREKMMTSIRIFGVSYFQTTHISYPVLAHHVPITANGSRLHFQKKNCQNTKNTARNAVVNKIDLA